MRHIRGYKEIWLGRGKLARHKSGEASMAQITQGFITHVLPTLTLGMAM